MSMNTVIENGYKGLSRDTNRSSGRMLTFYTLDTSLEEVEVQNDDDIAIVSSDDDSITEVMNCKCILFLLLLPT